MIYSYNLKQKQATVHTSMSIYSKRRELRCCWCVLRFLSPSKEQYVEQKQRFLLTIQQSAPYIPNSRLLSPTPKFGMFYKSLQDRYHIPHNQHNNRDSLITLP